MKQTTKRLLLWLLALVFGLLPGMSMTALARNDTSTYTVTIPSELAISGSGWNDTAGIRATGTLASAKRLSVTASSGNGFALVSGENRISYKLAASGDNASAYETAAESTVWKFPVLSLNATDKTMGIVVEDYSNAPAGNYSDTVTFTVSVETLTQSLSVDGFDVYYNDGDIWNDVKWNSEWVEENGLIYLNGEKEAVLCTSDENAVHINDLIRSEENYRFVTGE